MGLVSPGPPAGFNELYSGEFAPFVGIYSSGSQALTASRAYIVRFVARKTRTVTKIAFHLVTAAGANDNCDAGIFNSTLTTLLGSAGSTAGKLNGSSNSVQTLTMQGSGIGLVAGTVYYAAFAAGTFGGSAAALGMNITAGAAAASMMGGSAPNLILGFQAAAFPLAAPFTPTQSSVGPVLALLQ